MFVYYKHLVIIGHNDRFSHALSVRKYEEHNLDSLIENQCLTIKLLNLNDTEMSLDQLCSMKHHRKSTLMANFH